MKRMQLILAMIFALLCVCFSGSFAFADSENASAANANEASCETDAIVGTVKIDGRPLHAGEFDFGVKYAMAAMICSRRKMKPMEQLISAS